MCRTITMLVVVAAACGCQPCECINQETCFTEEPDTTCETRTDIGAPQSCDGCGDVAIIEGTFGDCVRTDNNSQSCDADECPECNVCEVVGKFTSDTDCLDDELCVKQCDYAIGGTA